MESLTGAGHSSATEGKRPEDKKKQLLQEKILGDFTQYEIDTLKSTIAHKLDNAEFGLFINTCISTGLNPFMKQIIPVIYESEKNGRRFDIQVPVEGIEHLARQKEGWQGYELQLVCEKDEFKVKRDKETGQWVIDVHEFGFPRGKTMGAYCIVPRAGFKDVVIFMEVAEVEHLKTDYRAKTMWGKWFNDMFKKHIKKRGLREQFGIEIDDMQDLTGGPEKYENDIPQYKPETQLEEGPSLEDLELEIWEQIEQAMKENNMSQDLAEGLCRRRFEGKTPLELSGQQLAAFKNFIKLEGQAEKDRKQKAAKQAASYQYRESAESPAEMAQDEPVKEPEIVEEPKEEKPQEQPAKKQLEEVQTLEEMENFFNTDGQGQLF